MASSRLDAHTPLSRSPMSLVCASGPLVHYWYEILNKVMISLGYSAKDQQKLPVVLGKVALDQLVFSPPFNMLYFHAIGMLQGTSPAVVQEKIARDFVPLMLANWKVRETHTSRASHAQGQRELAGRGASCATAHVCHCDVSHPVLSSLRSPSLLALLSPFSRCRCAAALPRCGL